MKTKLLGYTNMTKRKGKVIFILTDGAKNVIGQSCQVAYLYDELSDKVTDSSIGKNINLVYGSGYNGKAFLADVVID